MLLASLDLVRSAHIVLASASPRRVQILNEILTIGCEVIPSTFPEDLDKSKYTPKEYVQENARQKALEVYTRMTADGGTAPQLIVGADTVVVADGSRILEKPPTEAAARAMLESYSGSSHEVCTGVALLYPGEAAPIENVFVETTSVDFAPMTAEAIAACAHTPARSHAAAA